MNYLLDTDSCIGMIRATARKSLERLQTLAAYQVFLSSIVKFELLTGAERSQRPGEELNKVELFCRQFGLLPFDGSCAAEAAKIRAFLEPRGMKIGPYDTLIAGVARVHNLAVVTRNVSEFQRVPGLRVENWES